MTSLRQLADAGRTVIAVTHSMQAIQQCDRVLYLAEGGRVAYFGPPGPQPRRTSAAATPPTSSWPSTPSRARPGRSASGRTPPTPATSSPVVAARRPARRPPSRPRARPRSVRAGRTQLATLVRRQVALLRSDRRHLALLPSQGPVLGAPALARHAARTASRPGCPAPRSASPAVGRRSAMFVALSATWLGASNAVREIVKERHILRREVDAGLSPSAYVAAKGRRARLRDRWCRPPSSPSSPALGQQPPTSGALLGSGRLELAVAGALVGLAATGPRPGAVGARHLPRPGPGPAADDPRDRAGAGRRLGVGPVGTRASGSCGTSPAPTGASTSSGPPSPATPAPSSGRRACSWSSRPERS